MKRTFYYNYIEEKLNTLAYRIEVRGRINILDLNIHSETFFADLCNIIFNLKLRNLNSSFQNIEGIDLIDEENKVVVQVSSTCTKAKIENSLSSQICRQYRDYDFKFISVSKAATNALRRAAFENLYHINFDPSHDIWDIVGLLRKISSESVDKQKMIFNFIKNELGQDVDVIKLDSNLAKIVNVLAEEKLDSCVVSSEAVPFDIEEKIDFNDLQGVKDIIDDYKIFYNKLNNIYNEFDKEGKNKSFSVLQEIKKQFIKLKGVGKTSEEIFYGIIENVIDIIINSSNYVKIPVEELEVCADIVVVDAFIRCKIFKNPKENNHVVTG